MGGKSAPKAPDPKETSAAQTGTNVGTAIANSIMNNYNQVTPDGTLNFDQTGSYTYKDPYTGQSYTVPRFTATQVLSKAQQAIKDQGDGAELNLAKLANSQSGFLNDYLGKPWDADAASKATADNLFKLGSARLDPRFAQERASLDTKLSNQGIKLGTAAYDRAIAQFDQGKNDAYNQLALTGQGQAFSQAQASRNQPINEITALLSGSQVSQPNYVNPNTNQIPTTDVAGIINQDYKNRLGAWQQQQANSGSMLGGLFSLGSAGIMKYSDERLKDDMHRVGETDDGQPIYAYRYKDGGPVELGVSAQETEKRHPSAVAKDAEGYRMVNYGKLFRLGSTAKGRG